MAQLAFVEPLLQMARHGDSAYRALAIELLDIVIEVFPQCFLGSHVAHSLNGNRTKYAAPRCERLAETPCCSSEPCSHAVDCRVLNWGLLCRLLRASVDDQSVLLPVLRCLSNMALDLPSSTELRHLDAVPLLLSLIASPALAAMPVAGAGAAAGYVL